MKAAFEQVWCESEKKLTNQSNTFTYTTANGMPRGVCWLSNHVGYQTAHRGGFSTGRHQEGDAIHCQYKLGGRKNDGFRTDVDAAESMI